MARPFEFETEKCPTQLSVLSVSGIEAISAPYHFEIDVQVPRHDTWEPWDERWFEPILGHKAKLTIAWLGSTRTVHGVVTQVHLLAAANANATYRVHLDAPLAVLGLNRRMRIYQDMKTKEIVDAVLKDNGILDVEWSLWSSYETRNYCVQYRETDLNFVLRLLEEDGVFFFFKHEAKRSVLVFADSSEAFKPIEGSPRLPLREGAGMSRPGEAVRHFAVEQRMRPKTVVVNDYDFKRPQLDISAQRARKTELVGEIYDFPGEYVDPNLGKRIAEIRMQELETTQLVGSATSDSNRLVPGMTFTLTEATAEGLNREYVVFKMRHNAVADPTLSGSGVGGDARYQNSFSVLPAKKNGEPLRYRPPRTTPRPVAMGTHTATVVGPEREEVYTDAYGRVKVRFHWDREGHGKPDASCWIRVAQAWAGASYGGMDIPRIGQEVLVAFLEADPDRPVIIGRVYNGVNPVPYPLPEHKTRTTIKSATSIGGEGFNELMFEDKKGGELVFLQAQRNAERIVKLDEIARTGRDETALVGRNQRAYVGEHYLVTIGKHDLKLASGFFYKPPTETHATHIDMVSGRIRLSTGGASITLDGDDIRIEAKGKISIQASGGDVDIQGGPDVKINC